MDAIKAVLRFATLALALMILAVPSARSASSGARPSETGDARLASNAPAVSSTSFSTSASLQADPQFLRLVGQLGGPIKAVAVQGNYAYVGIGPRLVILDVSVPTTITVVGQTDVMPDIVQGLAISGAHAYVADGAGGLRIVSVSNPAMPVETGFYIASEPAQGVAVSNGYAYVISADCVARARVCFGEMRVFDISNVAAPNPVGLFWQASPVTSIVVAGGYAYLAGNNRKWFSPSQFDEGMWIVDVTKPAAPSQVSFYTAAGARDVSLAGHLAYVAGSGGLRIVNISNPAQPFQTGTFATTGEALGVSTAGDYAYVIDQGVWNGNRYVGGGLRIVNVSNPSYPVAAGFYDASGHSFDWSGDIKDVAIVGNIAYFVAADAVSLDAVNVSQPTAPTRAGAYETHGAGNALAVQGSYAYVASGAQGLQAIDVSTPAASHIAGHIDMPGNAVGVAVAGHYAYVAVTGGGLRVVNILTPTALTEVGVYTFTSDVVDMAVRGNYVYLATYDGIVRVLSISNPAHPVEVGSLSPQYAATKVAASDSRVFAYGADMLYVLDVSNPAAPMVIGSLKMDYGFYAYAQYDLKASGSYAYLLRGIYDPYGGPAGSFKIIDASNPVSPTIISDHWVENALANVIAVTYGVAYVGDGSGLCLVDVSIPALPTTMGCGYGTPGGTVGVGVAGGNVYALGPGGLYIFRESFSIGGQVAQANRLPFPGVTVSASGGMSATTNADGVYTFTNLLHGTYLLTPTLGGYAFWPATRTITVPPDTRLQNFTILPAAVSVTLTTSGTTSLPATLAYADTQGLRTQVEFPAGAVTQTTTAVLTPTLVRDEPGYAFTGHAFDLAAFQGNVWLPDLTLGSPATVTIHYSDYDVRVVENESQLVLWGWAGSEWKDAAETCNPPSAYIRDTANNVVSVPVCSVGRLGLFGPTHQAYLLYISRSVP